MDRKSKGFVKLEWTCPNCNTRNPGPVKSCQNCGAPQPENVQFEMGANQELIKDENERRQAAAGADIHCGFCGTRNPATAQVCKQCGGDLKEGQKRAAGRDLGALAANAPASVTCTNCGQVNPATSVQCAKCGAPLPRTAQPATPAPAAGKPAAVSAPARKPFNMWLIGGGIAFLLLCCAAVVALFALPTRSLAGTVQDVHWQTSVAVQEQQEVHYSDQQGSAPSGADNVSCHTESKQVCEDKTIDQGNGFGEVVQECHDESTDYCSYDMLEWKNVHTYELDGNDLSPQFAQPSISGGQRVGDQSETFTVDFTTEKGPYTYTLSDPNEYARFQIGSAWQLHMNALGAIVSVEPSQ